MIHITKYQNKKLYIATERRYTNLEEIKSFVQNGIEVQVTYHPTNEDVTAKTLVQVLGLVQNVNERALRELIQRG